MYCSEFFFFLLKILQLKSNVLVAKSYENFSARNLKTDKKNPKDFLLVIRTY